MQPVMSGSCDLLVLRSETRGCVLAERLYRPGGLLERLLGLLVRPPLGPGEALWLDPCGGIHTWGMPYPIDVLFLNARRQVVGVARQVRPWRLVFAPPGTRSVVELPAGAGGAEVGDQLSIDPPHPDH